MRIGIEATCWNQRRGYGRQLRGLLRAAGELAPHLRWVLFMDSDPEEEYPVPSWFEVERVAVSAPAITAARAAGRRSLADMVAMSRALSRANLDVLLFPTVYTYLPVFGAAVKVLMIHDVIAERFPKLIFPTVAARTHWRVKSLLGRWQADWIVTVSEFSKQHLLAQFGLPPTKMRVIGEAPDAVFRRLDRARLSEAMLSRGARPQSRLVTYVGGFGPHKNLLRLVEAFEALVSEPRFDDVQLVFAGEHESDPFHSGYRALRRRLEGTAVEPRVLFTGYLPDAELVTLLNCSSLAVLPSLMEGFGLPAVEAAACGLPVVVTRNSPLPELLGEGVRAIDPEQTPEIGQAMARLLDDEPLRRRMGEHGRRAASGLSWAQAARQLLALLDEIGPQRG